MKFIAGFSKKKNFCRVYSRAIWLIWGDFGKQAITTKVEKVNV